MPPVTDGERLRACREPEEWKWWIEGVMLGEFRDGNYLNPADCLFCCAHIWCHQCNEIGCTNEYPANSDRYFAGWDRLRRAGIV